MANTIIVSDFELFRIETVLSANGELHQILLPSIDSSAGQTPKIMNARSYIEVD